MGPLSMFASLSFRSSSHYRICSLTHTQINKEKRKTQAKKRAPQASVSKPATRPTQANKRKSSKHTQAAQLHHQPQRKEPHRRH